MSKYFADIKPEDLIYHVGDVVEDPDTKEKYVIISIDEDGPFVIDENGYSRQYIFVTYDPCDYNGLHYVSYFDIVDGQQVINFRNFFQSWTDEYPAVAG